MAFAITKLVKQRPKTPVEQVTKAKKCWSLWLQTVMRNENEPLPDDFPRCLKQMKVCLLGDHEREPVEEDAADLAVEICKKDFLLCVCQCLYVLDFEARKDATAVFGACIQMRVQDTYPGAEYIQQRPKILEIIFSGYDTSGLALNYGAMFRNCLRMEPLCRMALLSGLLYQLFDKVEVAHFDVASDAFSSLQVALTHHKGLVGIFLNHRYTEFFSNYEKLLISPNYVTRRRSLTLLRQLLSDQGPVMVRFIKDNENLVTMMNLLKDSSRYIQYEAFLFFKDVLTGYPEVAAAFVKEHFDEFIEAYHNLLRSNIQDARQSAILLLQQLMFHPTYSFIRDRLVSNMDSLMAVMNRLKDACAEIQFEAFHVFKVFVVNPRKAQPIVEILVNNQEKLLRYLENFHSERDEDDEQFFAEKLMVLDAIRMLGN